MALNVDKNNLPKVGQDFRTAQELARSKVQSNPFGAVKMDRVEVRPDPTYTQQAPVQQPVRQEPVRQQPSQQPRMVQQPQTRPAQNRTTQNERPQAHITANGRVIKTSVNGNTYSYEDKFDHSKDVMLEQDAKFLLFGIHPGGTMLAAAHVDRCLPDNIAFGIYSVAVCMPIFINKI